MGDREYDLVVIGTGSGGAGAAFRCRRAGWKVAIVDRRPFGGTCALRGCDPKKVLVGAAELVDWRRRMEGKGVQGTVKISWPELMAFKRSFTDPVPEHRLKQYREAGIDSYQGKATFLDPHHLQVDGQRLRARYFLIAAGARPAPLKVPGEEHLITSTDFLELDALPGEIVFIGGGYISFEFAHVAARAGARVKILHRSARPLKNFEPDLVGWLVEASREIGIEVLINHPLTAVEKIGSRFRVVSDTPGGTVKLEADLVVHGAGRVPEIDDLNLEAAGVAWDARKGVLVNEYLQSVSAPHVYAAGDAAASPGLPLTPVAGKESAVVAENLLHGNRAVPDYRATPTVVFTIPVLASVGLREEQARAQGLQFRVKQMQTAGWYSSRRIGEKHSGFKTLIEEKTDRLLGAHLLYPHAEELINLFALAMRQNLTVQALKDLIYAYPTSSSDIPYML